MQERGVGSVQFCECTRQVATIVWWAVPRAEESWSTFDCRTESSTEKGRLSYPHD